MQLVAKFDTTSGTTRCIYASRLKRGVVLLRRGVALLRRGVVLLARLHGELGYTVHRRNREAENSRHHRRNMGSFLD